VILPVQLKHKSSLGAHKIQIKIVSLVPLLFSYLNWRPTAMMVLVLMLPLSGLICLPGTSHVELGQASCFAWL
jgi:hypothetical protein